MRIMNYRDSIKEVLKPIFNYTGFYVNNDGLIEAVNKQTWIRYENKHFYIPIDGVDHFRSFKSDLIVPFSPFTKPDHLMVFAYILCDVIDKKWRDENDDPDEPIIKIAHRDPSQRMNLPSNFRGCIWELLCRKDEVIAEGISESGDHCEAVLAAMLSFIWTREHQTINGFTEYFTQLKRDISRIEKRKSKEYEMAKNATTDTLDNIAFVNSEIEPMEEFVEVEVEEETNYDEEDEVIEEATGKFLDMVSEGDTIFENVDYI